ncbi:Aminotransferase class I and II [Rhizoctonia solani]|uniref:Glutamate pyruvate transaminase n=1 Tax=Rhizoctonia solani TaxID=456999 RepID=A0A8H7I650_9AGAM|nr:Aminotransferase class I and II [Rhizoctonia solani]
MPPLTANNINPTWKDVQYAAAQGDSSLPFDRVVNSNIGNPQQKGLDQKPITFTRQVAALLEYPELMETGKGIFPADAIARAKELYDEIGSIGAYSHSQGVPFIRKSVAEFIEARDGHSADPSQIFLTAGASAGVSLLISMLISSPKAGILIPIPQYPLYTATLAQQGGIPIPYYLDESKDGLLS